MTQPGLFILAILTILATPGPTNTLLATASAAAGVRRSLPLLAAELLGYLITVDVVGLILRPVLTAEPMLGTGLKLVVACYLGYVALRLWRGVGHAESKVSVVTWRQVFTATLLNPKGLIFALAVIPFGNPDVALYLALFAVLTVTIGTLWLLVGCGLGVVAGERRRFIPRLASAMLIGFAGLIAASALG